MRILRIAFLVLSLLALPIASYAANSDIVRLGVMEFVSKANGVSPMEADAIMDVFTRTLSSSKNIALLERNRLDLIAREHRLAMSGLVDVNTAAEVGKLAGMQYILLGAVTELSRIDTGANIPIPIAAIGGLVFGNRKEEVRVTIDIRIVDVTTSEVCLALSETGRATNTESGIRIAGFDYARREYGGLEARAIEDAVKSLSAEIREFLGESSHVLDVGGNKNIRIDVGSTAGAKPGALYLVYADGKPIRNMSGEVIDMEKIYLAALKVNHVEGAHSVSELVAKAGKIDNIRRGDKIEPTTKAEIGNTKFAATRPSSSGATRETPRMAQTTTPPVAPKPPPPPAMATQPTRSEQIERGEWLTYVPKMDKKIETEGRISEPVPGGGVKYTAKAYKDARLYWNVEHSDQMMNHWEIEATIDRLDKGGGGVYFGRNDKYMAVYVSGTKIFLTQLDHNYTTVITEAPLNKSQYTPGPMVLKVELFRAAKIVKCSVNGNECLNYDVMKKGFAIPAIEQYGFLSHASESATTSIFRKISVRYSD
ncbi:hypothetical protein AGMMS50276_32760 [Synergistales bacterium]|nr:hypothetical protein AGMMS50276_32760 [Synergistales bacterium]